MQERFEITADILTERTIPVLTISRAGLSANAPRVIVLHGLFSRKEHYLEELYALARLGIRASALDLTQHGERPGSDSISQRFDNDYLGAIQAVVYGTVADIAALFDLWDVNENSAGLLAISAGGLVAHAAAIQDKRIGVVAAVISSPDWMTADPRTRAFAVGPLRQMLDSMSPVNHPESYPPKALQMLVGEEDALLTAQGSILLHGRLLPIYDALGMGERLQLKVYPGLGHTYLPEMRELSIDWLGRHLLKNNP